MAKRTDKKDFKEYVNDLIANSNLGKSDFIKIFNAKNNDELIECVASFHEIDTYKKEKIWIHVINSVWSNCDPDTVFGEKENILFKMILDNQGFLKQNKVRTDSRALVTGFDFSKKLVLKTPDQLRTASNSLSEMGLINIYKLSNDVIYVLDREFYDEVFPNDEN